MNTLIKPSVIAREALAHLYNQTVMSQLVHRDFDAEFTGKSGATISIRKPATFTATVFDRATGIVPQDATESSVPVTLDTLIDVSFVVTAEELTLEIDEFSDRLILPAVEAISQKIDAMLIAAGSAGFTQTIGTNGVTPTDPKILIDAAKILNDNAVPRSGRAAVIETATAAEFLKDDSYSDVSVAGSTEGLRDALLSRRYGFEQYETQNLLAGDSLAFHKSALALVTRTLAAPGGVAPEQVSVVNYKGFGLRVVQAYDNTRKEDVVSIDLLTGVAMLDANRGVKILG